MYFKGSLPHILPNLQNAKVTSHPPPLYLYIQSSILATLRYLGVAAHLFSLNIKESYTVT